MAILDMKERNHDVLDLGKPSNFRSGRLYQRPTDGVTV